MKGEKQKLRTEHCLGRESVYVCKCVHLPKWVFAAGQQRQTWKYHSSKERKKLCLDTSAVFPSSSLVTRSPPAKSELRHPSP